jgi:putative holliday junction resolvase
MNRQKKRIAAIDFGLKRIGIAISDDRKKLALPFTTVDGGKKGVANTVAALREKQGEIERILVGLPLLMSGEKSEMAKIVETFAKALEEATGIPVELCDERLSSKMADQGMRELSMNRKERAERIDMAAAALLLQSYLDKNQ